jgi:hypothetical protein
MIECKAKESLNIVNDCFNKKDIILVNLNKQLHNWIDCSKTLQKNIVSLDKNINNLEKKSNKRIENLDADLKINVGSLECLISDLQRSFTALEDSLNQEKTRNEERFNKSQKYGEDLELRLNELKSSFEIEKSKNDEFREFIKLNLKNESSIEKESTEHMSSNENESSIEKESTEHMSSNETDSYNETESSMDLTTIDTFKKSNSDSEEEYFAVSCNSHEEEDIHTMRFHSDLRELNEFHSDLRELNEVTKENIVDNEPNNEQNFVDDNLFEIMKTKRGEKRKLDQVLDSKKVQKIHNNDIYSTFESYLDNETKGESIAFTGLCQKMSSTLKFSCYNDLTQYFTKSQKYVKRKDNNGKFLISVNPNYTN